MLVSVHILILVYLLHFLCYGKSKQYGRGPCVGSGGYQVVHSLARRWSRVYICYLALVSRQRLLLTNNLLLKLNFKVLLVHRKK